MAKVLVMEHPLIQHKIGIIRRKETSSKEFRELVSEVAMFMAYEATRDLKLTDVEIERTGRKENGSGSHSAGWSWNGGRYAYHGSGGESRTHWSVQRPGNLKTSGILL